MTTLPDPLPSLSGCRIIAAIYGIELFGHERGNIEVFKTLRHLGAEVLVGCSTSNAGGHVRRELRKLGFETFLLPFGRQWSIKLVFKSPSLVWRNPAAVWRCSRAFEQVIGQFNPTHIHLGSPLVYSYLALALFRRKVPLIYRMGDCPPTDSRFNMPIWKMAMRRANRLVAISDFVRRAAVSAGACATKLEVIYNLAPTAAEGAEGEVSPDPDGLTRLVYVGAVSRHKGLVLLVQAVNLLKPRFPSIRLDVFGQSRWDGDFRCQLIGLIEQLKLQASVRMRGHASDPRWAYRRAAIHVAPSLWEEPLGNVVLEAKREGIPSVVFPSGGLTEMVRHHVDGVVCEEKTASALAAGIKWFLEDTQRIRAAGKAARKDFESRFGPERFAREWAAIYSSNYRVEHSRKSRTPGN